MTNQAKLKTLLVLWLPSFMITTLLIGLIYGVIQQELRQTANDPQIQLAEDIATAIGNKIQPQILLPAGVNIAKSLSPYITIYD